MALDYLLDKAGNKYGGTVFSLAGVGDIVQDVNGIQGTVISIILDQDPTRHRVLVRVLPASIPGDPNPSVHEVEVFARNVQIVSHADGTGLVSGGAAVSFPTTVPPTSFNFLQNPTKVV